jgi:hypothetical protein
MSDSVTFFRDRTRRDFTQAVFKLNGWNIVAYLPASDLEEISHEDSDAIIQRLTDTIGKKGGLFLIVVPEKDYSTNVDPHLSPAKKFPKAEQCLWLSPGTDKPKWVPLTDGPIRLERGEHLLVPVDKPSYEKLRDLKEHLDYLPYDQRMTILATIRRPSLDWRVQEIEARMKVLEDKADLFHRDPVLARRRRREMIFKLWQPAAVATIVAVLWSFLFVRFVLPWWEPGHNEQNRPASEATNQSGSEGSSEDSRRTVLHEAIAKATGELIDGLKNSPDKDLQGLAAKLPNNSIDRRYAFGLFRAVLTLENRMPDDIVAKLLKSDLTVPEVKQNLGKIKDGDYRKLVNYMACRASEESNCVPPLESVQALTRLNGQVMTAPAPPTRGSTGNRGRGNDNQSGGQSRGGDNESGRNSNSPRGGDPPQEPKGETPNGAQIEKLLRPFIDAQQLYKKKNGSYASNKNELVAASKVHEPSGYLIATSHTKLGFFVTATSQTAGEILAADVLDGKPPTYSVRQPAKHR